MQWKFLPFFLLFLFAHLNGESVPLRYNLEVGDVYAVKETIQWEKQIPSWKWLERWKEKLKLKSTKVTDYKVTIVGKTPEGDFVAAISLENLTIEPLCCQEHRVRRDAIKEITKAKTIEVTFTPFGQISQIAVPKELEDYLDPTTQKPLRLFTHGALKCKLENLLDYFSEDPVSLGDTWWRPARRHKDIAFVQTFTLSGMNDTHAEISFEEPALKKEGKLSVDRMTGWVSSAEYKQATSGKLYLKYINIPVHWIGCTTTRIECIKMHAEEIRGGGGAD